MQCTVARFKKVYYLCVTIKTTNMNLKPGTSLQSGRYQIIDTLGHGGFGITYLATQVMAGRNVCIKEYFPKDYYKRDDGCSSISLLSQGLAENMSRFRDKFIKEAQTIATLDHPHIIHIFDVFEENNTCYYVMEYIEGESLNNIVKRGGAMEETESIKYIRCIASALDYIHEQKINHLDVKPGNIMVRTKDERAILIDFGLSKHYDNSGDQTSSTPVGISHGYAPMEQYQTGGVSSFSPSTDIYSLGATLYFLVTGKVPPQATVVGEEGIGELPAHLSESTRKAIEASMNFWRKDRPQSIAEFLSILEDNTRSATPTTAENRVIIGTMESVAVARPSSDETIIERIEETMAETPAPQPISKTPEASAPMTAEKEPTLEVANSDQEEAQGNDNRSTTKQSKWGCIVFIVLSIAIATIIVMLKCGMFSKDKGDAEYYQTSHEPTSVVHYVKFANTDKKYSDFLQLPHGLEGYFDLYEAIKEAKVQDKPIFVSVTGHACNNCREMEASVWSNNKVLRHLEQNYIVCALYVDDKTKLAKKDYYTDANGKVQTELGSKNAAIVKELWGVTSTPAYVLITPNGGAMLTPVPMGYERNVEKFAMFLQTGLDNKKRGITYTKEAQEALTSVEIDDNGDIKKKGIVEDMYGDSIISWEVTSLEVEAGLYEIRLVGTIKDGYHGYPMDNFSAPLFFIGSDDVPASEISEPLADQLVDHHGEKVYKGNVEYVFRVKGHNGHTLMGSVMATMCSDKENYCTQADHSFWVRL